MGIQYEVNQCCKENVGSFEDDLFVWVCPTCKREYFSPQGFKPNNEADWRVIRGVMKGLIKGAVLLKDGREIIAVEEREVK